VLSRTPTQVASHAQKYFIRQSSVSRRRQRASLFDLPPPPPTAPSLPPPVLPAYASGRETALPPQREFSSSLNAFTPSLFGGGADGSCAAALLASASAETLVPGLGAQLLWEQWLAVAGGAPSGAAFHRLPVEMALLHNPRLFRPTPVRAGVGGDAMRRAASMPELAALALSEGEGGGRLASLDEAEAPS